MRGFVVPAAIMGLAAANAADAPTPFKPTSIGGAFVEQFTDDWSSRWTPSEATKMTPAGESFAYVGKWSVEEPVSDVSIPGDKGLVAKSKATHHAISAPLSQPLDPKGKPLVIQYEVKFQKGGNCGGGYMKLLEDGALADKEFTDKTPWVIMFGPDMTCPGTKVHFIFRHQNPITKEFEEKHLKNTPSPVIGEATKLYTLIVHPDNTYQILLDNVVSAEGSLLEDFAPPVNPYKEIDDPEDKKPADWVDETQIPDPDAVKPDDWDEEQLAQIDDEKSEMPEGWLLDEPTEIRDPDVQKPEEWDDEEDGEWLAPLIKNPKCDVGCGPWTRPKVVNPLYKGKWSAPLIPNPAYKGAWAPRKIANPNYFMDEHPANFHKIGAVGFEIWSMTEDIMFDNIYIGQSPEDAKALAAETFRTKETVEKAKKEAEEAKKAKEKGDAAKAAAESGGDTFMGMLARLKEDPIGYAREQALDFIEDVQLSGPVEAFKAKPQVGGTLLAILLTLIGSLAAIGGFIGSPAQPVSKSTKTNGADSMDSKEPVVTATSEPALATSSDDSAVKKRK